MELAEIQSLYDAGHKEIVATMASGEKRPLRLFISSMGSFCYFAKGKRRYGFQVRDIAQSIDSVSIKGNGKKQDQTVCEKYISNLRKFKKAYTVDAHPNLWGDLRDSYSRFDVDDFAEFIDQKGLKDATDTYTLYKCLCEYCQIHNLHLITENKWKTTTIQSNKSQHLGGQYNQCVENIKRHLDNKETFKYSWQSNYDVSVSANTGEDGIYRAWFSLEFRGCGNGHYYLLINENQAVFAEDD
jgi:hypothetical protein